MKAVFAKGQNRTCVHVHSRVRTPARLSRCVPSVRRGSLVLKAAPGSVAVDKNAGFLGELRSYAMKLHTREQAPKEGKVEAPKQQAFEPTREGYLRFLAESKAVYDTIEEIFADGKHPALSVFNSSGLERGNALAADIAWFKEKYGLTPPPLKEDGPGLSYSRFLRELAASDPPGFICHYYNHYFAHTAGGTMIGKKVASMILDNEVLRFYKWEGDLVSMQTSVREKINGMAEGWSEAERTACMVQTPASFQYAGGLMRCMTATS